ncbi:MAG: serine/threonine protein kinase [Sandaracinaceae bacterium]|nr:serine/threonine protein kinase [Sandaracinaceae bacterium]
MAPQQSEEGGDIDETLLLSGFTQGAFFLDRYRLERMLGQGAMGKVFRAYDTVTDRPVAVKVLHRELAKKEQVLARFRRESRILRELGHPGIVRVYDSGMAPDGMDYLVMELLEGRTLKQRLQADGPMTPEELLPILVRVCDALGAVHLQGVVHRDLKPENLFLTEDGDTKVVDFGLSRLATGDRMTKTGMMLGTPRYMPPEQIRSAKDADARTDQYAVGVITHEALAGSSPFPAGDPGQLLGCVMEGRILMLEEQRPGLPKAIGDVVRKAMSRDPKERFATIGAYVEAYAAAIGRKTGRSMLAESGFAELFSEADDPDASGEIELPDEIVSSAAYEPLRFTVPPSMEPTPERLAPRFTKRKRRAPAEGAQKNGRLWWVVFVLALVAVTCLSTAIALGVRTWLRSTGGIATPSSLVPAS